MDKIDSRLHSNLWVWKAKWLCLFNIQQGYSWLDNVALSAVGYTLTNQQNIPGT